MTSTYNIKGLVDDIRRRWRRRALLQGGALVLLVLLGCATVLLLLYTTVPMRPVHLLIGLVVAGVLVTGVLVQYLARPLLKRLSDQQIALYVEEKIPGLEDRLNSAVEVDNTAHLREDHSGLVDRLIDDAVHKTRAVPLTTVIDQKRERLLGYSAIAFLAVFLIYGYTVFDKINVSDSNISLASLTTPVQPFMTVEPGDAEIEKGASQEILVTLRDESDRDVILVYKEGDGEWQKEPMRKGLGEPAFLQEFHSIQEPIQYYVEVGERKSDPYTIRLYEFPDVAQIDVTYRFPEYTGLPARVEEGMGDIRGLKGSTVILNVQTTGSVETAEMVLDDGRTIPLNPAGDGRFRGSLALQEEGFYTLRLTDAADKNNKFPTEYQIVPVEDEKPYITITDPQRDVRVNALEEVLLATTVQDDYGVKDVRLAFSVNGAEEQTVRLMPDTTTTATEVMGEHLFFLEDYSLQPGDVISYYVQAEDYFHADAPESTDMYFIEVIPFDQEFRQASNMPGQGGQPSGLVLSQQQIIAATWKLHRERGEMEEDEVEESLKGLVQAQQNLKASIEERINSTAFSRELQGNETNRQIVEHLREATQEMDKAVVDLTADRLKEALTPERRALTALLRADALNKEQQVAMNQGGQGGQGGATEERMTELMDLELDISKDKYETQQQAGQQGQQNRQMDEALERIRDLARRQQNLANQNRQQDNLQGEDKKRHIEKLKRDQDELRRETERLANNMQQQSRQQGQEMSREAQERLDRVAENMREAEQALRRGDEQQARAQQQQALSELQRLQRELQMASNNTSREQVEDLAEQFDQVREQEQQLARDL
ncbi:MAG TPA: DUF4175 family protein, partial [Rhodothermales bacterium]|nr:DUF4175 family protein [Rhodothermales bacterium]